MEVGIPFSDPIMDGPVIQQASQAALEQGATPESVLAGIGTLDVDVPVLIMLYYNTIFRMGDQRFAARCASSGVSGLIIPDLPSVECGPWLEAAADHGLETVQFVAPTTPDDEVAGLCELAQGFVYGLGLMGVTGERDRVAESAIANAKRMKAATDRPVLIGVGVSNPEQAREVAGTADGVIIGTAIVRRMLEGGGPTAVGDFVAEVRASLDELNPRSNPE